MTVDTGVKIEGGEKCALEVVVSSCEDLPPPPTTVGECNGDGKDDYVFVNGSDADDHGEEGERNGDELNHVSELNADVEDGGVKVNGGDHQFEIYKDNVGKVNGGVDSRIVESCDGDGNGNVGEVDVEVGDAEVVEEELAVDRSGDIELDNDDKATGLPDVDSRVEKVNNGEIEEEERSEEVENHDKEVEKVEDEIREAEVVEDNANFNVVQVQDTESEPVDGVVKESEADRVEADVEHESQEDSIVEMQPLDGEVKGLDSEAEILLPDGAITEESADCQQQDLGDSKEELDPAEAAVSERADLDSAGMGGSQDLISEPQQQSDESECKGLDASDLGKDSEESQDSRIVSEQSVGGENQSNFELTAAEVDVPVLESTGQSDETSTVAMLSEESDKPIVDHGNELDKIGGERNAELNGVESSVEEVSCEDQVTDETGLVDEIDREVSSEDVSFEKPTTDEDATNSSMLNSANEAAVDEGKDLDGSHLADGVSEKEQGVIDDGLCAGADESSAQPTSGDGNDAIPNPVSGPESEVKSVNVEGDLASKGNFDSEDNLKPKISFGSFECIAPFSHNDNININTDILNRSVDLSTSQSNVSDENLKSNVGIENGVALLNSEANEVQVGELNHDKPCAEVVNSEQSKMDEVSSSPQERTGADSPDGQNVNPDLVREPFYYLIRIPRFEDATLSEQIRLRGIAVEERTKYRQAVQDEYRQRQAIYWEHKTKYEAAKSEERAAYKLMVAKRREIDSAQSLINLTRNAVTLEDVDSRIRNLERRIQHETMKLDEEKRLVREIKQLNHQREQLAANTRKQQELQQALDRRVETEQQLKVLKSEMAALRENHAKAELICKAAKAKCDEEGALLNDLREKVKSADSIRQEAYKLLQDVKKQAFEKRKHFYNYKDDAKAANDYAAAGEKDALERHCVNQVEKFMELWNNNDEFREDYLRCNIKSTLYRFRTLDGRSLGPDEEPPSLGNASDTKVKASAKVSSVGTASTLERDFPLVAKNAEEEPLKKAIEQKNKVSVVKKRVETTAKNSLAEPSGRIDIEEKEEEHKLTKEEEELAQKAEQKRKEEEASRLKEQRRLEEKAKAQEAQERKRRIAEKAQARAEFRARKEAEEKEKEREKRAKKKGKKKGFASEITEVEPAQLPESTSETIREPEVTEKPVTVVKKSHKPALYTKQVKSTKSISAPPAPLRNRGRRRIPQWVWWLVLAILTVILIFPLGSIDIVGKVKRLVSGSSQ